MVAAWFSFRGPLEAQTAHEAMPGLRCPNSGIAYADESTVLMEETLLILKPDVADRHETALSLLRDAFASRNLSIVKEVQGASLTADLATRLYAEHRDKAFFAELVQFMTRGPITLVIIRGVNAIRIVRQLLGPTDPSRARETDPDSLRARFGRNMRENAFHASDSSDSFGRELWALCPLL